VEPAAEGFLQITRYLLFDIYHGIGVIRPVCRRSGDVERERIEEFDASGDDDGRLSRHDHETESVGLGTEWSSKADYALRQW
jgi:hypothetical protein